MEIKEILRNLGFSEYESKVLIFLNSISKAVDAKTISKEADVPLTKLYSILIKLENKNLIIKYPGKINLYRIVEKKNFIERVKESKEKEIEKKKKKYVNLIKNLESSLKGKISKEVSVRYFTSDKEYWKVYNDEVKKLRKNDIYRIINSMRWSLSFLPEEIKDKPDIKSMIINDLKALKEGRFKLHHMVNVKAFIQNIIKDLKSKEKIIRSIAQVLYYYQRKDLQKNHYITLAPEMKNILVVILKESTFFEFYSPENHTKIHSAVQIKSKEITKDFARWFDAYSKEKHDPKKDYDKFKKEMLQQAKKLAEIKPSEIEKEIKKVEPIYF